MSEPETGRVECYSGHTYAQEPRAVVWRGRRLPVTRIEQRWRTPEGPAFVVETEAGLRFQLSYGELEDTWMLQPLPESDAELPEPSDRGEDSMASHNQNPGDSRPPSP